MIENTPPLPYGTCLIEEEEEEIYDRGRCSNNDPRRNHANFLPIVTPVLDASQRYSHCAYCFATLEQVTAMMNRQWVQCKCATQVLLPMVPPLLRNDWKIFRRGGGGDYALVLCGWWEPCRFTAGTAALLDYYADLLGGGDGDRSRRRGWSRKESTGEIINL